MSYTRFYKAAGAMLLAANLCSIISPEFFAASLSNGVAGRSLGSQGAVLFSRRRTGMKQTLDLSITVKNKLYSGQGKLNVAGKIGNVAESSASVLSIKYVYFYLYEVGKTKEGDLMYPSVFIARHELKGSKRSKPTPKKAYEFEVDLATLGWDNGTSSILTGDNLEIIPAGQYHLVMKLVVLDDGKTAKEGNKVFREYVSDHATIEIKKRPKTPRVLSLENSDSTDRGGLPWRWV